MNVYLIRFSGHYLGGEMIVIDETKRKAFNRAKKEISHIGLSHKNIEFSMEDVELIDLNIKTVIMIDDGDY
jgi:hypothetical protein